MRIKETQPLIDVLIDIRNSVARGAYPRSGICCTVDYKLYALVRKNKITPSRKSLLLRLLGKAIEQWPGHSGDPQYPVPCPVGIVVSSHPHAAAYTFLKLWQGRYGDSRIELLNWLIEVFSQNPK